MKKAAYILLFLLGFFTSSFYDGPKDTQSVIKALYLYNFAISTDWPSQYKKGDFIIGVYNDEKVYDELVKKYRGKPIGGQKIAVKKFTSSSSISRCHILFVDKGNSSKIGQIAEKVKQYSTLLVTEGGGNAFTNGAIINFVVKNNKQTYDVSKKNAKKFNLVISSRLVELANNVERWES